VKRFSPVQQPAGTYAETVLINSIQAFSSAPHRVVSSSIGCGMKSLSPRRPSASDSTAFILAAFRAWQQQQQRCAGARRRSSSSAGGD
jgi:hypothetical protein